MKEKMIYPCTKLIMAKKFDFISALKHEIDIIHRAMSLRCLDDEEYDLLVDYDLYCMGCLSFSDLKSKYFNRYSNVC